MADFDLEGFVADAVRECIDENDEILAENCKAAGDKAARLLKQRSRQRTNAYKKGWRADVRADETGTECTVHNKARHQLTHLLESGHRSTNQTGRSFGTVPGDHVIEEVFREVSAEFMSAGEGS